MAHAVATHPGYGRRAGPALARLFQRLLALTFAVAWWSLGRQVVLLIGSVGLYGLSFQEGMPSYVDALLEHLCHAPSTVQPLFVDQLPQAPKAVRIAFYRYHFTSLGSKNWWTRTAVGRTPVFPCR